MVGVSLTCILMPHAIWLLDCVSRLLVGVNSLGITVYLERADAWGWLATAHHFYLAPLLVIVFVRHGTYTAATLPAAVMLCAMLTVASRVMLPASENVNYAFRLLPSVDQPLLNVVNTLDPIPYLAILNGAVIVTMLLPTAAILKRLTADHGAVGARPGESTFR
jgi:hypothetical protein